MANRTEELEKLVVEQALQLAELHGVAAETTSQPTLLQVAKLEIFNLTEEVGLLKQQVRNRVKAIDNYKQQLTVEAKEANSLRASNYELQGRITEVSDLTEEVRLLKQKLTFSLETINLQKEVHGVEAKENNTLRGINSGLSNEKILETVKYQQELFRSTALKNENDKLKKSENFLIVENAKLNAKIAELESGVIIMDEEDCENPKVVKYCVPRVVAILADNNEDFIYCKMLEKADVRSRTTYARINHLQQLENRKGYDAIVRSESWTKVVGRDGKYNTNSISDMKEFDAYLNKKTYGF